MSKKTRDTVYLGRGGQLSVYAGKFLRLFIAEKQWLMLIMSGIIAYLVAAVVGRNIFKTMEGTLLGALALSCVCLWNGVFNSIQVVCKERSIIKREHRSGLSITAYLASHMMVQLIICIVQVIIMMAVISVSGVTFPEAGLITDSFITDCFVSLLLMTYASDMLGLMVSCIVKNTTMAMTVMPFLLIVQLLFAGVAFPLSGKVEKLSDFTITKWGVSAVCVLGNFNGQPTVSLYNEAKAAAKKSDELYKLFMKIDGVEFTNFMAQYSQRPAYEYSADNLLRIWGIFIILIFMFAALGILFLKFIDKDKRS